VSRRALTIAAVSTLVASCLAPTRARYLGGGYTSVDEAAPTDHVCFARARHAALEPAAPLPVATTAPAFDAAPPGAAPAPSPQGLDAQASSSYELQLDGRALRIEVRATLGIGSALRVPFAEVADATEHRRTILGFVYGIDLRPYRKIAFVVDAGAQMCTVGASSLGNPPLPIDEASEQLVAALAGLPAATDVVMLATSSGIRTFVPQPGASGRRAAMQWTCSLFCASDTSLAMALLTAFGEQPDVVVVLSNTGDAVAPLDHSTRELDLQLYHADPAKVLDRVVGAVPVIAVDLARTPSTTLAVIAERTGGIHVRR
jgi:hypothetical protein